MQYIGKPCVKCGKAFTADDDIVVCPECGSPHHRECYKEENKCANEALHSEGYKWFTEPENIAESENLPDDMVRCSSCGNLMSADDEACPNCNAPNEELIQQQRLNYEREKGFRHIFGISPDSDMNGVSAFELLCFVKVNVLYYLVYFKQIALSKRKLSLNILCLFFPSIYFANRRMWLWAVISAVLSVLLTIPYAIGLLAEMSMNTSGVQIFSEPVIKLLTENSGILNSAINICNWLDFAMRLIFCLFANLMYYKFAVHSIKKLRERTGSQTLPRSALSDVGGVKILNTPLMILMTAAMTMIAVYISVMILESFI